MVQLEHIKSDYEDTDEVKRRVREIFRGPFMMANFPKQNKKKPVAGTTSFQIRSMHS